MSRCHFLWILLFALSLPGILAAQDDAPPIVITSPDAGTTFAYGTIKTHSLSWNKSKKILIALVTFVDGDQSNGQASQDTHEFRLPGVTFDEAKGVFFATSAKGESIPVAHIKKTLFIKSIETTSNAVVRILHPRGDLKVILEAIDPNDPAMHPHPDNSEPDATHQLDIGKILN